MTMTTSYKAYNYIQVSDRLATSGIIPLEEFPKIADDGYACVINLLPDDNQYAQEGEADTVEALGMRYVHIPIDIESPTLEDFERFAAAMDEARNDHVWVHCAANWRVSAFVSLYGQAKLGWDAARGKALVDGIWEPTEPWRELADRVLALED